MTRNGEKERVNCHVDKEINDAIMVYLDFLEGDCNSKLEFTNLMLINGLLDFRTLINRSFTNVKESYQVLKKHTKRNGVREEFQDIIYKKTERRAKKDE